MHKTCKPSVVATLTVPNSVAGCSWSIVLDFNTLNMMLLLHTLMKQQHKDKTWHGGFVLTVNQHNTNTKSSSSSSAAENREERQAAGKTEAVAGIHQNWVNLNVKTPWTEQARISIYITSDIVKLLKRKHWSKKKEKRWNPKWQHNCKPQESVQQHHTQQHLPEEVILSAWTPHTNDRRGSGRLTIPSLLPLLICPTHIITPRTKTGATRRTVVHLTYQIKTVCDGHPPLHKLQNKNRMNWIQHQLLHDESKTVQFQFPFKSTNDLK